MLDDPPKLYKGYLHGRTYAYIKNIVFLSREASKAK
jgi:hypothetical protein